MPFCIRDRAARQGCRPSGVYCPSNTLWVAQKENVADVADDYAIPLEQLGPCDYATKPENGDLIFFNARKLHAVLPGEGTDRLTISGFIGYRGDKEPLTVWS